MRERPEQPRMLRQLNERHAVIYAERSRKLSAQLTESTQTIALEQQKSETKRGIPINNWSFEVAVSDAWQAILHANKALARRGGSSPKTDALQEVIVKIVHDNPRITWPRLLERLRPMQHGDLIDDIDDASEPNAAIHFMDRNGKSKKAPLSGLKDRLSRAKKEFLKTDSREAAGAN